MIKTKTLSRRTARHPFSLVEIMVAMAILLLMMSFLFEVVITSQKLWTATERRTDAFSNAQTILTIIGNDIRKTQFAIDTQRTVPLYVMTNYEVPSGISRFETHHVDLYTMWIQVEPKAENCGLGMEPISYVYDRDDYCLYRIRNLDKKTLADSTGDVVYAYDFLDLRMASEVPQMKDSIELFTDRLLATVGTSHGITDDDIVARNLLTFSLETDATMVDVQNSKGKFTSAIPKFVSVRFEAFDRASISEDEINSQESDSDKRALFRRYARNFNQAFTVK